MLRKQEPRINALIGRGYGYFATSSIPTDFLEHGRGYGGTCIIYRSNLKCTEIVSNSVHFTAATLSSESGDVLLVSVYLPCYYNQQSQTDFLAALSEIQALVENRPEHHVIIGGDWNYDATKALAHMQSRTRSVSEFCERLNLDAIDSNFSHQIPFTFRTVNGKSWVDHFFCSESLSSQAENCFAVERGYELSDHIPLQSSWSILPSCIASVSTQPQFQKKVAWYKCTPEDLVKFQNHISAHLEQPHTLLTTCSCTTSSVHQDCKNVITQSFDSLSAAIKSAATATLPHTKPPRNQKGLLGWSPALQKAKSDSIFWSSLWHFADCPRRGVLHDTYRHVKHVYKSLTKQLKRDQGEIRRAKMAEQMARDPTSRNLCDELKRLKGSVTSSRVVDGQTTEESISNAFAANYSQLYNSQPSTPTTVQPPPNRPLPNFKISPAQIKHAISQLKRNKTDQNQISSNHVIHAEPVISTFLAILVTASIRHPYLPEKIRNSTLCPIPKKGKPLHLSPSYRAIALSSAWSKVIEIASLFITKPQLKTSNFQFAYKEGHSTTMCTHVVKSTIELYTWNQTPVYAVLLDMSKAFDLVRFDRLFDFTLRDFPPTIKRFFHYWYSEQKLSVRWGQAESEQFGVSNGTKQGGIISPHFYAKYMDPLFDRLAKCNAGCVVNGLYVGALGYADDTILLAPTIPALQKMLNICEEFGVDSGLVYNPDKCQLIKFPAIGRPTTHTTGVVTFCGRQLDWTTSVDHLGHKLTSDLSDDADVRKAVISLNVTSHTINSCFKWASPFTRMKLLLIFAISFYGSLLWKAIAVRPLQVAWNNAIRTAFGMPRTAHTAIAHIVGGTEDAGNIIAKRYKKFARTCLTSKNTIVRTVTMMCEHDMTTTFGQNGHRKLRVYSEEDRRISAQVAELFCLDEDMMNFLGRDNVRLIRDFLCYI